MKVKKKKQIELMYGFIVRILFLLFVARILILKLNLIFLEQVSNIPRKSGAL